MSEQINTNYPAKYSFSWQVAANTDMAAIQEQSRTLTAMITQHYDPFWYKPIPHEFERQLLPNISIGSH